MKKLFFLMLTILFCVQANTQNWNEVQKIVASDRDSADAFGWPLAIDGNYLIVGAGWEDEDPTGGNTLSKAGSAYIFESPLTGISESDIKVIYEIYPNPTSGNVNIALGETYKEAELILSNIVGEIILSEKYNTTNVINLEIKGSSGLYFVEVITPVGKSVMYKVLKE
ncbi:T9SS type A sorting domain-containing protein [Bacteroidota bacterium]